MEECSGNSKIIIKLAVAFCTAFQAYAIFKGQPFSPMAYCGAIAALFGGNTVHEQISTYLSQKTEVQK